MKNRKGLKVKHYIGLTFLGIACLLAVCGQWEASIGWTAAANVCLSACEKRGPAAAATAPARGDVPA